MPWQPKNLMETRTEFALRAQQSENFRELCREYGISAPTGYKWRRRLLEQGVFGLGEESRRPKKSPQELGEEVVCRMVRIKEKHRHWGPRKIRQIYLKHYGQAPSESTFKRILERAGLTEKRRVRRVESKGHLREGARVAEAPNDIWSVDFKGWWYDAAGKCEPLTVRDEYSRCVLAVRALKDSRTVTVQRCFEELFARHGLPGVIRSDNGAPFATARALWGLSKLSVWWLALGIDLERSRPGCPQDNGAHERMHRDIRTELEGTAYEHRQAALETWRREYNEERPHEALGQRRPAEVYTASPRRWRGAPEELEYAGMSKRRVSKQGDLRVEAVRYFLTTALGGWDVGLKRREDEGYDVYFAKLLLGRLEPSTGSFVAAGPGGTSGAPPALRGPGAAAQSGPAEAGRPASPPRAPGKLPPNPRTVHRTLP
jgi:transposase InsO family protein